MAPSTGSPYTVCVAIGACPYECPVAPFEVACLIDARLRRHGVRDRCRIVLTCPVPWPMPEASRSAFATVLSERGIEYRGDHTVTRIEPRHVDAKATDHIHHPPSCITKSGGTEEVTTMVRLSHPYWSICCGRYIPSRHPNLSAVPSQNTSGTGSSTWRTSSRI